MVRNPLGDEGTQVWSLAGEPRSHMLHGSETQALQLPRLSTTTRESVCLTEKILYYATKILRAVSKIQRSQINK